jgi:2-iminobutanoate/2-iminopropanoate deaminase
MTSDFFTRRNCSSRISAWAAALGGGLGLAALGSWPENLLAQTASPGPIQKLDYKGNPVTQPISPVVVHNGLIYVSGQGANDNGTTPNLDITAHVQKTMDNVKALIEGAGGDMDHVLTLTVYLATLEFYQAMNKAYRPYFPHRGPARCTVSVAGIPGGSLIEVSCIAAVVRA